VLLFAIVLLQIKPKNVTGGNNEKKSNYFGCHYDDGRGFPEFDSECVLNQYG